MFSKVSIVMPIYNAELFIKNSVGSILEQSYENIEIILVDDCSQDSTYDILSDLQKSDKRIKLYRNKRNEGVSEATNVGMRTATGEFITFHDHDDLMLPQKIETCVHAMKNAPDHVGVLSLGKYVRDDYSDMGYNTCIPDWITENEYAVRAFERSYIPTWSMFLRRLDIGPLIFDREIRQGNQDFDFFINMLHLKRKILFINQPVILFKQRKGSLSHQSVDCKNIYSKHNYADVFDLYRCAGYGEAVAYYALGLIAFQMGDYGKAELYFNKLLNQHETCTNETFSKVLFMLGSTFFKQSNFKKCLKTLQTIDNGESRADVCNNIGVCCAVLNLPFAQEYFAKALRIMPNYRDALDNANVALNKYTFLPLRELYQRATGIMGY